MVWTQEEKRHCTESSSVSTVVSPTFTASHIEKTLISIWPVVNVGVADNE